MEKFLQHCSEWMGSICRFSRIAPQRVGAVLKHIVSEGIRAQIAPLRVGAVREPPMCEKQFVRPRPKRYVEMSGIDRQRKHPYIAAVPASIQFPRSGGFQTRLPRRRKPTFPRANRRINGPYACNKRTADNMGTIVMPNKLTQGDDDSASWLARRRV